MSLSRLLSLSLLALAAPAFAQSSTTTLTVTGGGSVQTGTLVTLTATTTGPMYPYNTIGPVKIGLIKFCDVTGGAPCTFLHLVGTAQLNASGVARFKYIPGPGTHTYQAVFDGTDGGQVAAQNAFAYAPSSSATSTLAVTGNAVTTLTKSGSQGNYTLTARVAAQGLPIPTGTLSFKDTSNSNAVVGTASLGAGTSAANPKSTPATGASPYGLAAGDFDGDGLLDLAVGNQSGNSVTILKGNGDGTFTPLPNPIPVTAPRQIFVGDFNNDGILDLLVADSSAILTSLQGKGDGSFTQVYRGSVSANGFTASLLAPHVFDDGELGFAFSDGQAELGTAYGLGNGQFAGADEVECPYAQYAYNPYSIAILDVDHAYTSAAVLGIVPDDGMQHYNIPTLGIANNFGGGDCPGVTRLYTLGTNPVALATGDFTGDGVADIAIIDHADNTLTIFKANTDGTYTALAPQPTPTAPNAIVMADFDGDGIADLAITNDAGNITVLKGKGDGTFTTTTTLATGATPAAIVAADFNGEGHPDFAVTNPSANTATVILSAPVATATATATGVNPGGGTHLVNAANPGDTHYFASTSNTVDLSAPNTATTVTSVNPASSTVGLTTTLTATVSNTVTPTLYPVGTVAFSTTVAGTTYAACSATVSNGVATCTYTVAYGGANTITAVFNPTNPNAFTPTADATGKPLTVAKASPSQSAGANDQAVQSQVASTLTIILGYPGPVAPTGTITVRLNGVAPTNLGTPTCKAKNLHLNCSYPFQTVLAAGQYTLTYSVAADFNYNATSGISTLTVTAPPQTASRPARPVSSTPIRAILD